MARRRSILVVAAILVSTIAVALFVRGAFATEPLPIATVDTPATVLLGDQFPVAVSFDNQATSAVGYGPYLDVFVPVQGADGDPTADPVEEPDGLTYDSATYLGLSVNVIEMVLACDGSDAHPYTGDPIDCSTVPDLGVGDVLLVIELPFGSFTTPQPPAVVDIVFELSELADVDHSLTIAARAGFRYGADPLNNPLTDPPISGPVTTGTVEPTAIEFSKSYDGPEDETATGPNYPRTWTLELTVADGLEVEDVELTDLLPDNVAFLGAQIVTGAGSIVAQPDDEGPHVDGEVVASFPNLTGTGGVTAAIEVDFFIPEFDAHGDPVIDPVSGQAVLSENFAAVSGTWIPIDDRDDPVAFATDVDDPLHVLIDRSLAIQKSGAIVDDTGAPGPSPGDTIEWTLEFQVSDFFTFDALLIEDVLSDGQRLDGTFEPVLSVTDPTGSLTNQSVADHVATVIDDAPTCATEGDIAWTMDLSAALAANGIGGGRLTGGLVNSPNDGPTQGTIVFRTVIDDAYRCLDDGLAVDSLDAITNEVDISGDVINNDTGDPTGERVTDDSASGVTIVEPSLAKSIYARNGDTGDLGPQLAAGDTITYRLTGTLPVGNHESVSLTDYLPLPTLVADELSAFVDDPGFELISCDASGTTPPDAGAICYGPAETRATAAGVGPPSVATDGVGNSLTFEFPDVQDLPGDEPLTVDLLFTLTLTDQPFADGLFLTNQARMTYADSFETTDVRDEIVQFELTNPQPAIHKGVIATDSDGDLTFDPAQVGPGTWTLGDTPRFAPSFGSDDLAATPLGSSLDGVWAGDLVAFAVVVENLGSGLNGAFDVTIVDQVPDGFAVPAGGAQVQVHNGAGTPLGHSGDLFDPDVPLVIENGWDGAGTGGIGPYDDDSGTNLAVITYVLQVADTAALTHTMTNTATLENFAAAEGADSYPPVESDASVTMATPTLTKELTSTSQTAPPRNATIGELAEYEVIVTIPPSSTDNVALRDTLDVGLAFVSFDTLVASDSGLTSSAGDFATIVGALDASNVTMDGRQVTIDLGTLTNSTDVEQTLMFTSTIAVLDVPGNSTATGENARSNAAELLADGDQIGNTAQADSLIIVEPALTVTKTANPTEVDAQDVVEFTIVVNHPPGPRSATAFDVELEDIVPTGFTYNPGSFEFTTGSGLAPDTIDDTAGELRATWSQFPVDESAAFTFAATVNDSAVVDVGTTLTNQVDVTWTSLPGDHSDSASDFHDDAVERTYDTSDTATVDIAPASVDKELIASSADHTDDPELTIGEVATFEITVTLPEGELGTVTITDAFPAGLAYMGGSLGVDDSGFEGTLGGPTVLPAVAVDELGGSGENLVVTFDGNTGDGSGPGVVADPSPDTGAQTEVVLTYEAVVLDVPGNQHGGSLTNSATVTIAGSESPPGEATIDLVEPDVEIDKTFGYPDAHVDDDPGAAAGDTVTITLEVSNNSGVDAFDLEVSDLLDGDIFTAVAIDTAPSGWSGVVTPVGDDWQVTFTGDELVDGASVTFVLSAELVADLHEHVTVPGTHTNTAEVAFHSLSEDDDEFDERRQRTNDDDEILDLLVPDLRTTKTGDATVAPGDGTYTYTIRVDNDGGRLASNIEIIDLLPDTDFLTFQSASDAGVHDPDAGDNGTVTWTVSQISAGGFVERTVTFDVVDTVPAGSDGETWTNTATAQHDGSNGPDPTPDNNTDEHEVTLDATVSVVVAKTGPVSVETDEQFSYTITVTNIGNEDATGIELLDELPEHVTFDSASGGGVYDGDTHTVTWAPFDLSAGTPPDSELDFEVTVTVDEAVPAGVDELTNRAVATVAGDESDATHDVELDAAPVLEVTKTDDTAGVLVAPGEQLVYTIVVENVGDQGATGIEVVDSLPDDVTFLAASDGGSHTSGEVTWVLADELPAGETVTLTLTVNVNDPVTAGVTSILNAVVATDDGENSDDPATDDDDVTTRLNVTTLAKELVSGSAAHTDDPDLTIGEIATYRITVSLPEGNDIGTVTVTDQIPAGMAYLGGTVDVDDSGFEGTLGAADVPLDPDGGTSGQPLTVTFTDVEVTEDDDPDTTSFTITYDTVVLNVPANTDGETRTNTASIVVAGATTSAPPVHVDLVEPDVSIAKTFAFPDAHVDDDPGAAAGDTVTITLEVSNNSGVDAFDLEVSDLLDGDIFTAVAIDTAPSGWDEELTQVGDDWQVTFTGDELVDGNTIQFVITAELADDVPAGGDHTNTAQVVWHSLPGDPDHTRDYTDDGQDTLGFIVPDIRVVKVVDGSPDVEPGEDVTYLITVHNDGGREAAGVVLTDVLPEHVGFDDTDGASGDFDYDDATRTVTWEPFDLAAGDATTFTVTVTVDDPVPAGTNLLTNTATAADDGSRGDDPTPGNNTSTADVALDAFVDLAVDKQADTTSIGTGDEITYTIVVTSLGNEGAAGISLVDDLPDDVEFVSADPSATYDSGDHRVTWPDFDLDGHDGTVTQATFTLTVVVADTVPAGVDTLTNHVQVHHPEDTNPSNDSDQADVDLDAAPDLRVTKAGDGDAATVGSTLEYTIEVDNVGDQDATGVTIVDQLPVGLTYVDASGSPVHVAGEITWTLPELAAGNSQTFTIEVTVDDPLPAGTTSLTNTVTVFDDGANGPDPTPDDNEDSYTYTTGADLSVAKEAVGPIVPGATATYEITVSNAGPETVRELSVVDLLPGGLSNPDFAPSTGTFDPATNVWDDIDLTPGDTIVLTVTADVSLTVTGDVTNTVTVTPLDHADPDPSNNDDDTTDPVTPQVNLILDKTLIEQTGAGGIARYSINVRNDGPSNATAVEVVDTLPSGLTFATHDGTDWTCTAADATVTCQYAPTLGPGDDTTVELTANIASGQSGTKTNHATVAAHELETDPDDNDDTATFDLPRRRSSSSTADDTEDDAPPDSAIPTSLAHELPRTGAETSIIALTGGAMLLAGIALRVALTRRLRRRS